MTWFPSLPFLVLHLWATRELCGGGMCLSFIERRLPGTETESGNSRELTDVPTWILSPGGSQGAREKRWLPSASLSLLPERPSLCQPLTGALGGNFPMGRPGAADALSRHRTPSPSSSLPPPPLLPLSNSHLLGFPHPRPNRTRIRESVTVTTQKDFKDLL